MKSTTEMRRAIPVLGTPLELTTYSELISRCEELASEPGNHAIEFSNTQIVTMRRHEPAFCKLTECFDFFVPDGMPLIWCLNLREGKLKDRVYGPTFMRRCITASPPLIKHYLLGGSAECGEKLRRVIREWNPNAEVVGSFHGKCDLTGTLEGKAEETVIQEINELSPDYIWIGFGTPKQQAWIDKHRSRIQRGVLFSVGFAFDVNAGTKKDAPLWMQRAGLTWVYRMCSEPRRLIARYFRYNSLFLFYLLRDSLCGRSTGPGEK